MKKRVKGEHISAYRGDTIRRSIAEIISGGPLSAKDISAEVRIPEKDVYEHLEHIQRSFGNRGPSFVVIPSRCKKCGFVFKKRDRLTKPSKCPVCRGQSIMDPLFQVKG